MKSNYLLEEFKKKYKVGRAVYWNEKTGEFCPRAYSATVSAMKANEVFNKFKDERLTA